VRRGVPRHDRVAEHDAAGRDPASAVVRDRHVGELDEPVGDYAASRVAADRAVHQRRRIGDDHAVPVATYRAVHQRHRTGGADPVPVEAAREEGSDGGIDHVEWVERADPGTGAGETGDVAALDPQRTNAENPAPARDRLAQYRAVGHHERPAIADRSPFIDRHHTERTGGKQKDIRQADGYPSPGRIDIEGAIDLRDGAAKTTGRGYITGADAHRPSPD